VEKNKIIIAGVTLFFLAFIFPPCYDVFDAFSGNTTLELRPLWEVQGSAFAINTTIWFTILGSIAFGTFIFARLAKKDITNEDEEEYECTKCGASVTEDQIYCHKCGEKFED